MDMEEKYIRAIIDDSVFGRDMKTVHKHTTVILAAAAVFTAAVYGAGFVLPAVMLNGFTVKLGIVIVISAAVYVFVITLIAKTHNKKLKGFKDLLYTLDKDELEELCRQARDGELYDTLYMLEKYLYIPGELLLIPYEEIHGLFIVFGRSGVSAALNTVSSAQLRITLTNEKTLKIGINRPDEFYSDYKEFFAAMQQKNSRIHAGF